MKILQQIQQGVYMRKGFVNCLAVLLLICFTTLLIPAYGNGIHDASQQSSSGQGIPVPNVTYRGEAKHGEDIWEFKIKFSPVDRDTGEFEGAIEWPLLESTHKIEGKREGSKITFREVEHIVKGHAPLNRVYNLVLSPDNREYVGTWKDEGTSFEGSVWIK
jgi:hypothetical protein